MKKIETERKYVIQKPDMTLISMEQGFAESKITQIYLSDREITHRIRRREYPGGRVEYTENTKRRISVMSVVEEESEISREEFERLSAMIDPKTQPVEKTRVTLSYSGRVLEIDIYPAWDNTCILEVEIDREDEEISLPSFIRLIKDVTGMREYSNHSMAYNFPPELSVEGSV